MKKFALLFLLMLSVLPAELDAQGNLSIQIIKPGNRRNVELGEIPVTVEITGGVLPADYTWQVLIDSEPQGIVKGTLTTNVVVPKPSGPHRIAAELYDGQGNSISRSEILVMAAPVEVHEPVFNRGWYVPAMGVFTLVIVGIIVLGLRLRPRTAT
jgi:hypothetical protein